MSLVTFWCGVAVVASMCLGSLIGWEIEVRQHLRECARARAVRCPVGDIAGVPHTFRAGSGVVVSWDILGDSRGRVEVCGRCAGGGGSCSSGK